MEEKDIPHFNLCVEPNKLEESFFPILQKIRPFWNKNEIIFELSPKSLSTGVVNTMIKCFVKNDDVSNSNAIMIRIHNKALHWIDRSTEVKYIKLLQHLDCAPKIIATFANGFCYHFFVGQILSHEMLKEEPVWRLIATDLAKFHSFDPNDVSKKTAASLVEESLQGLWNSYPENIKDPEKNKIFQQDLPTKRQIISEVNELKAHWKKLNPSVMLCHNDPRAENIIWNKEKETIHFVDFEGMNYNFQALELAVHFTKFCGVKTPDFNLMPSEDFQKKWLKYYLEKHYEFSGKDPTNVTDKAVHKLYVQVSKFRLVTLIMFTVIGCTFGELNLINDQELNLLEYSLTHMKQYYKEKDSILAIPIPE